MSTITSPVTGAAQTGFTSPTYTLTADVAPDINGKQWAVTALGGTQAGVTVHSATSPFTVTLTRPKQIKSVPYGSLTTSTIKNVPKNDWKIIVRKGVTSVTGQPIQITLLELSFKIPAGADTLDAPNIRGALSLAFGVASQISAAWGDSVTSGVL